MKLLQKLCGTAVLCIASAGALASSPHFVKATGAVDGDGNYTASFKEAGLANTPITYTLTSGNTTFTFQCYTKSGNRPQGEPNGASFSNQLAMGTFPPSRNGQITASLTMSPLQGNADCQGGGLKLCLVAAAYRDMVLTDTTNNVFANLPNAEVWLSKPDCDY
jgi:hypothetical protein